MKFLKSYKSSLILIGCVLLGGIIGMIFGKQAVMLEPLGNLFVNMMLVLIVPLVFFSVSSAIANMDNVKKLGKILTVSILVFLITSLIASVLGVAGGLIVNPAKGIDTSAIQKLMSSENVQQPEHVTILQRIVDTITVSDFQALLSRKNMLQLIIFSIMFGIATLMAGENGKPVSKLLNSGMAVMMKMIDIIMYYAPIGITCYFASLIGQLGTQILNGYLKVFILYGVLSIIYFFGFYTLYAFVSAGKVGIKAFWKNSIPVSATSLATCSSAACIPVNMDCARKIGVSDDISEMAIPLGTSLHKDGSVLGGAMKVIFLLGLYGMDTSSPKAIIGMITVSFLVGAVMGAIPNGGMLGEMFVLTSYGFNANLLPVLAVISTIIDAPATLINATGNTISSMLIARFVNGKNWILKTQKLQKTA